MIKTEASVTQVKFGKDGKASIGIRAKKGTVTLQELAVEKNIGDSIYDTDTKDLPKVEIEFFTLESIDSLIEALKTIKKNYIPPPIDPADHLALAC